MSINMEEFKKDKAGFDETIKKYRELYENDALEVRKIQADTFGIDYPENVKPEDWKNSEDDDIDDEEDFWGLDEDYSFAQSMHVLDDIDKDSELFISIVRQYVHHLIVYPCETGRALDDIENGDFHNGKRNLEFAVKMIRKYKKELRTASEAINEGLTVFDDFLKICDKYRK